MSDSDVDGVVIVEDLDGVYFDVDANGEVVTGDHIVMYTGYDEVSGQVGVHIL